MSSGLAVPWLVFAPLLLALAAGAGGLVGRVAGRPLGALRLPCGFALVVVVADACTRLPATARLATPLVVAVAVAGAALSGPWRRPRTVWPALAALVAFAVFAAPVVLSGDSTIAGYIKLDDTATWLAFADRVPDHGRTTAGLEPSTYQVLLSSYFASGYPMGSFLPLGAAARLTGHDAAWLVAPYLAVLAALLALALDEIAREALAGAAVAGRRLAAWAPAGAAAVAACAALLYGYALWGGIKELVGAVLIATFAGCTGLAARTAGDRRALLRSALPAAVTALAVFASLSAGGIAWLAPVLVVAAAPHIRRRPSARQLAIGAGVAAAALLVTFGGFLSTQWAALRDPGALGNLAEPLSVLQMLGVWPSGDFRFAPSDMATTRALEFEVAIAASIGIWHAVRTRAWSLPAYVAGAVIAAGAIVVLGAPWLGGKALAQASPALVLAALVGAAALALRGYGIVAAALAACIVAGVGWSDVLAYRSANLAPAANFAELETIGKRLDGRGPTLMTDFEPYGVRHFLRRADAEGASELRVRAIALRSGSILPPGGYADLDDLAPDGVLEHQALVVRRSPAASRPPAGYERTWAGAVYEVWERDRRAPRILAVLPLGDARRPGARPACAAVGRLARRSAVRRLVAPLRGVPVTALPPPAARPADWAPAPGASALELAGMGRARFTMSVPRAGRYTVWAQGSFPGHLAVSVAGRRAGAVRHALQQTVQHVRLGALRLRAGRQRVVVEYDEGGWRPGGRGTPAQLGGIVLTPETGRPAQLIAVAPGQWRSLCGRTLDWVAALGAR
jgi:hypothetical protein